jgi:hypothetical protein
MTGFTSWNDHDAYGKALERLLRDPTVERARPPMATPIMANGADPARGAARRRQKIGIAAVQRPSPERLSTTPGRTGREPPMTTTPWDRRRRGLASRLAAAAAAAAVVVLAFVGSDATAHNVGWKSGTRGGNATSFASWRGTSLNVAVGWAPWSDWSGMLSYFSSSNPRALRAAHANVSIAVGLFPKNGGNLADCAAGKYAANHKSIGSRLVANGVGDAELRLGWEPNSRDKPWTAAGKPPEQWKACFANAARALKGAGPNLRIAWHMNKKAPRVDVNTIWPAEVASLITNIGVSHYDDEYARFGTETHNNSPWGLRAWLAFARGKGKKLELAEWGVGRRGDRPEYIQGMHDFLHDAGDGIAHEGYFNAGCCTLYPSTNKPRSAARYRELF